MKEEIRIWEEQKAAASAVLTAGIKSTPKAAGRKDPAANLKNPLKEKLN